MIPGGGSDSPSAHQHDALWQTLAQAAHIVLSPEQLASLHRYLDLLLEANASMNLTRIVDRSVAEVQHIGDALTLLPFVPAGPIRIADVGSGGGVPGIVLAIARPDAAVCLIESTQKKARFLQTATDELKLSNVEVLSERAEAAGRSDRRETFNVVTARAVAVMDQLAQWCLPLVRTGGKLLAMKGQRVQEELPKARKTISFLGGGKVTIHPVQLPGVDHHVIVEIHKARSAGHWNRK